MTNPLDRFDVNGDGRRTPPDALLLINELNRVAAAAETQRGAASDFWDVNGDGNLSPLDALQVINVLNGVALGSQTLLPSSPFRTTAAPLHELTAHALRVAGEAEARIGLLLADSSANAAEAIESRSSPALVNQEHGLPPEDDLLGELAEDVSSP